jgi:hypothetical protein
MRQNYTELRRDIELRGELGVGVAFGEEQRSPTTPSSP